MHRSIHVLIIKTGRVDKKCVFAAELACLFIHLVYKFRDGARNLICQNMRGVVAVVDNERTQKAVGADLLPGLEPRF